MGNVTSEPEPTIVLTPPAVNPAAAMWARRYLAVIAFEALLALSILYAALSLAFASNVRAVVLGVLVILVCAPIFWLLIRVMARLQVPRE